MKLKKYILLVLFLGIFSFSFGQFRVALHHAGTTSVFAGYSPFIDAYAASTPGDTIYLPGASFSVPPIIDKRLVIMGTGIYPDSTTATGKTYFNSGFTIGENTDSIHIEGIYINGSITFDNDTKIDKVLIRRNYINGSISIQGTNTSNYSDKIEIRENIISGYVIGHHTINLKVFNNVLNGVNYLHSNAWIANNIFVWNSYQYPFNNVTETLFENNIIEWGYGYNVVYNNTFIKNTFNSDPTGDASNNYSSNFIGIAPSSIVVNYLPPLNFATANYHLVNPTSYIGTTGNQIGIYGGNSPKKEGLVPMNPHIISKTIAPQTTPTGDLNINIQVGAQGN
ncbi:MAG: hypothetical protein IPG89_14125 [Bacteroidetes bacterium]|nr:hypothetical protein [Bacteroidota bacterium]